MTDMLEYYKKQVKLLRPLHVTILPGQDDLHVWFPVAGFDREMMAEVYHLLAELDHGIRKLIDYKDDIAFFRTLVSKHSASFKEMRVQLGCGRHQVGVGLFVELKAEQSFRALAPLLNDLEDADWLVHEQSDSPEVKWRDHALRKGERRSNLRVSIGWGERAAGCRIVETGETKPVLKIICDDVESA